MIFKAKARGGFTFLVFLLFIVFNSTRGRRYARQSSANEGNKNNYYHHPHFIGNRSVIVQLFEWKFVDIATECRTFLGPQGYAGVQLSPVLEHTVVKTEQLNHPWWERYEVISYRLATRSGDEAEFWSMSRICNEHGVRIYVDVVLNHMAAPLHFLMNGAKKDFLVNTSLESNVNISSMNYSNVTYTQLDFHKINCQVQYNARDAHEIRNCQWKHHPDLDHYRNGVQKHIVKMMNKFIDMGVAGFRIDTAKYMWPIDLKNIYQQLKDLSKEFNFEPKSRPFIYQDVFDFGLDSVSKTEYITYGVVSEYLYAAELATILNGKVPLSSLINWGPALGFVPSTDALVFIDSHDTQRGLPLDLGQNRVLTYKQRIKYIMANVFMLAHPYGGIKRIMSSYYFQDEDQGPPTEDSEGEDISSPQFNGQKQCTKASGWVCEHRWPPLMAMVQMANYFAVPGQKEESIVYFQTNGQNQVAFCRGPQAFVAINNDVENDFNMEVFACLESGLYCDLVTGGKKADKEECHGKQLLINEQGYAKLQLPVADGNRLVGANTENEVDEAGKDQQEEEAEEEASVVESYGILVIYKGSKIEPQKGIEGKSETSQESHNHDKESVDGETDGETGGEAEAEDVEAEDVDAEDAEAKDTDAEDAAAGVAEAEDAEAEDAAAGDTEAEDAKAEDAEAGDAEAKDAAAEDAAEGVAEAEDAEEEDAAAADAKAEDAEAKDAGAADAEAQDAEAEDAGAEDAGAEDAEAEDGQAEDAGAEDAEAKDAEAEDAEAEDAEAEDAEAKDAEAEAAEPDAAEPEAAENSEAEAAQADDIGAEADAADSNVNAAEEEGEETPESEVENESPEVEAPNADNENEEKDKAEGEEEEIKDGEQGEEDNAVEEEAKEAADEENEVEDKQALTSQQSSNEIDNEVEETENEKEIEEKETEIEAEPHEVADLVVSETSVEQNAPASQDDLEEITENVEKGGEINQSRNLEEPNTEEQVERPSADIVKDKEVEKATEVLAAGILSNPKGNGNNG